MKSLSVGKRLERKEDEKLVMGSAHWVDWLSTVSRIQAIKQVVIDRCVISMCRASTAGPTVDGPIESFY